MQWNLFTRTTLIQYLLKHEQEYPDKGDYEVEIRGKLLASPPPSYIQHDDQDRVVILIGVDHK